MVKFITIFLFCCLLISCTKQSKEQSASLTNIVPNSSFEEGTIIPKGWTSHNQYLDTHEAWPNKEAHTGKCSLMIDNIGATNAYWQGPVIKFPKGYNAFDISLWTKTKGLSKSAVFFIRLAVYFEAYTSTTKHLNNYTKIIIIPITPSTDWQETQKTVLFYDNITKITSQFYLNNGTGGAWFDDYSISVIKKNKPVLTKLLKQNKNNIIFISVKDEAANSLSSFYKQYISSLGGRINNLKYRESYLCVIYCNKILIEKFGEKKLNYSSNIENFQFSIISAGLPFGNFSSIKINNTEYSKNRRGLNIVIYNLQNKKISSYSYDTSRGFDLIDK